MSHPIFFSFSGDSMAFAQKIKRHFADDLVYFYSRNGVDGTNFPDEILSEISQCKIFVIFLSAGYVKNDSSRPWCRRELITATKRIQSGSLKNYFLIQVDNTALDVEIVDPDSGVVSDVLKVIRDHKRAFSYPSDQRSIEHRIATELAQMMDVSTPILPRTEYQNELRTALETGSFETKTPVVFVSGFHGAGRKTLISSVMENDFRHLTPRVLPIDNSEAPEDLLRLIWGEVLEKSKSEQREMMKTVASSPVALSRYYKQLSAQLTTRKTYLILSREDFADFGEAIPSWVGKFFNDIPASVQPLFFFTTPRPLSFQVKKQFTDAREVNLPSLEDHESLRLVNMVIAACDPNRVARWRQHIPFIIESASNSPKMIVDIVKLASRRSSLDFLEQNAQLDIERFDQRVVQLINWAWDHIRIKEEKSLLLDVLNSLGVAHFDTLEEIFKGQIEFAEDLYELVQLGMVEHLTESTFRIPPAFRRKLNFYLINPELKKRTSALLRRYAKEVEIGDDAYGGITLTNNLQIKLSMDVEVSERDLAFVTGAMLFKAGWERYRRHQHAAALKLFRRAYGKMEFIPDETAKLEVARFYGLACAREGVTSEMTIPCAYLSKISNFSERIRDKARAASLFIQGFSCRLNQDFIRACELFEQSLDILPAYGGTDHQRSQILNELVQCLLKLSVPEYSRAVDLARTLCSFRETPNNLDVLLRALLAQTYYQADISEEQIQKNFKEIARREHQLKIKCEGSNLSFYVARVVDRLEKERLEDVRADNLPYGSLDLSVPIRMCEEAFIVFQEQALLCRKWDLMLHNEKDRDWHTLHLEATSYLESGTLDRRGQGIAARIRILTFDFNNYANKAKARAELDKYRKSQVIPHAVAADIARKIDMEDFSEYRMLFSSGSDGF